MARLHRSAVSAAVLVVYLVGVLAGGLHHHADEAGCAHPETAGAGRQIHSAPQSAADQDQCAICLALHQARTRPTVVQLVVAMSYVGEAPDVALPQTPLTPPVPTHARAPPAV